MNITVVGSGVVGRTVASGFSSHGHHVTLSSRTPEELADWSAETGIAVLLPQDALNGAEVIINATPGIASIEALTGAALGDAGNVIVLDLCNPLDHSQGFPRLSTGADESMSETIQAAFPDARVVKTLNTVNAGIMTNPGSLPEPTVQFICGNEEAAKKTVIGLLNGVGWEPDQILDLGDLTAARDTEHYVILWVRLMMRLGTAEFNLRLVRN